MPAEHRICRGPPGAVLVCRQHGPDITPDRFRQARKRAKRYVC